MSIAVSAVVRPSVCLRSLVAVLALCTLLAGMVLAGGGYLLGLFGACVSALAGLLCLAFSRGNTKLQRIDISGVGQIRLTVYQCMAAATGMAQQWDGGVRLLPGSTLWPGLLLLRLRRDDGVELALLLWPGNVAGGAFRPLAVACRHIAARGERLE